MTSKESEFRKEIYDILKGYEISPETIDEIIEYLKENYILLEKKPRKCDECVNCHINLGWRENMFYCMYYQKPIQYLTTADNCEKYFSGEEEARKSIAKCHYELTGKWII